MSIVQLRLTSCLAGEVSTLEVPLSVTVSALKEKLAPICGVKRKLGVAIEEQILIILDGNILPDDEVLENHGVDESSQLSFVRSSLSSLVCSKLARLSFGCQNVILEDISKWSQEDGLGCLDTFAIAALVSVVAKSAGYYPSASLTALSAVNAGKFAKRESAVRSLANIAYGSAHDSAVDVLIPFLDETHARDPVDTYCANSMKAVGLEALGRVGSGTNDNRIISAVCEFIQRTQETCCNRLLAAKTLDEVAAKGRLDVESTFKAILQDPEPRLRSVARAHLSTCPFLLRRDLDLESDASKSAKAKQCAKVQAKQEADEATAARRVKDEEKARAKVALGILFPLAQLQRECPRGVNPAVKEAHLTDADFQIAFDMSKEDFHKLPKWKQTTKKRAANLF